MKLRRRLVRSLLARTYALRLRASLLRCHKNKPTVIHSRINGHALLVLANEDVGRAIHFGGSYETNETEYLRKMIRSDAVCVDVGANVGYYTMLMAQTASGGSVHAFEPIALNAALLRATIELNGMSNVRINQCALGNSIGVVSFSQSSDSAYSSIHDTQRKPLERTLTVPVTTLDSYLEREGVKRVDILKADVEGAEGLVVAGASRLLSDETRRPHIVLLELFDQNLQAFGSSVKTVIEDMQRFAYRPFVITDKARLVQYSDESKAHYYNVLFLPTTMKTLTN